MMRLGAMVGHQMQPSVPVTARERAAMNTPDSGQRATRTRRLFIGESVDVPCNIEIEQTRDTLHAHVSLEGIEVEHGDEVLVHDAPSHIGFGERVLSQSTATVWRANPLMRAVIRLKSYLQLTELYEVGFQPKEEIVFVTSTAPTNINKTTSKKSED